MQDQKIDEALIKEAETYNLAKTLKSGSFLDVKDPYGTWYLAQVTDIYSNALRIHFDGWNNNYDDVYINLPLDLLPQLSKNCSSQKSH